MKRRLADASEMDRVPAVDRGFAAHLMGHQAGVRRAHLDTPLRPGTALHASVALELFDSQLESRHVDFAARELKQQGQGFYTIGSAGHEGNAAVAAALRPTDPALLHYRSGAFFLQRARQVGYADAVRDMLLGVAASSEEPIAGGRHKVFGSLALAVPPQTSTIASHLPKAVGVAFALERSARLGMAASAPRDAVVMCSFGDASANHSTAVGALNAACWAAYQGLPVPVLFVCEDNGIGISVPTPRTWVADTYRQRAGLSYFYGDGLDLASAYDAARAAVDHVRTHRRPAFLHLRVVRLLGHAGSDVESMYRSIDDIRRTEAQDPVVASAVSLLDAGVLDHDELLGRYEDTRARVTAIARGVASRPKLATGAEVMAPLAPRRPEAVAAEVNAPGDRAARRAFWGPQLPEKDPPVPLASQINRALGDLLVRYPELLVFGEDVANKGGVYGVTRELFRRARRGRVFDTLLDEQTILGLAIGAGQLGLLPVPEIQYLAYLHNAEDQLRGEAASMQFFSQGQFKNPMVVRVASYAYQKGFGGHFHNDNSVAVLRDIPGLVIASPARGDDAAAMLRTCVAAARVDGAVCVFLEPIALYGTRDLYAAGDGLWCSPYDPAGPHVPIGQARVWGDGTDLLIVSWANGLHMSLRVARKLERDHGHRCRVLDLRWLSPLPTADLLEHAAAVGKVLVVDETRRTGGVSEGIVTALVEGGFAGRLRRVAAADSFIPLGDAANLVLVQEQEIEAAARDLLASPVDHKG